MSEVELRELVRRLALENAAQYDGKTRTDIIVGKILAQRVDLRQRAKEIVNIVSEIVYDVNSLTIDEQKKVLATLEPEAMHKDGVEEKEKTLPPLPNVEKYNRIVVRFCPNPDGALHLGSARAAILCDEYAKMYSGNLILRFDDTDPKTKSPIQDAYDWIREDLRWLGVIWNAEFYQSDRLEIYYDLARKLLADGNAYVCSCRPEEFRRNIASKTPCHCRSLSVEEHLQRWAMMLNGCYREGEAVVRIKTDVNHPNPAVRDWPALRIIDVDEFPHPRTGSKYRVWPLFAFCCGVDDHELKITHVIRGKEHLTNSVRQGFLYQHLQWDQPEAVHYGRLKIVGTMLSKSKTREGIVKGFYEGWDDPRLGTLKALRRRGFLPETVRHLIIDVGPKPVDATISWSNVESLNRKLLDPLASRYFFVAEPISMKVCELSRAFSVRPRLHPSTSEHGHRHLDVRPVDGEANLFLAKKDLRLLQPGAFVRLMELFNVRIETVGDQLIVARFAGDSYEEAREQNAPLVHWVPASENVEMRVVMPDASLIDGAAEIGCRELRVGDRIQFERFGFARIDSIGDIITAYFTHR